MWVLICDLVKDIKKQFLILQLIFWWKKHFSPIQFKHLLKKYIHEKILIIYLKFSISILWTDIPNCFISKDNDKLSWVKTYQISSLTGYAQNLCDNFLGIFHVYMVSDFPDFRKKSAFFAVNLSFFKNHQWFDSRIGTFFF